MEDVIFAGTRDRKPTGMAEVSLTLIDPEVYDGADKNDPTELDLQDDMPADDWDEAEIRAKAADEVQRLTEENQPGVVEEVEVPRSKVDTIGVAFPEEEPIFAIHLVKSGNVSSAQGSTGEDARTPTSTNAVVLRIRRRKFNQQQIHVGEIAVTRRLFRSGDSEY